MTYLSPRPRRRTYKGKIRSKSVGTKMTEEDYDRCVREAHPLTVSEWNRALILRAFNGPGEAQSNPASAWDPRVPALMAELWALRYILLNGLPLLAADPVHATNTLRALVESAEERKADKARSLLGRQFDDSHH